MKDINITFQATAAVCRQVLWLRSVEQDLTLFVVGWKGVGTGMGRGGMERGGMGRVGMDVVGREGVGVQGRGNDSDDAPRKSRFGEDG